MTALALNASPSRAIALALAGSLVVAAAARIEVPSWPVPLTLQDLAVLVVGGVLGPRLGFAALLSYLAEGAAGLPVFAGGASTMALAGPTAGYLIGFPIAAAVTGWLAARLSGWSRLPVALAAGLAAIFVPGVLWLSLYVGAERAVSAGLLPFLPGAAVKAALAAVTIRAAEGARARMSV